MLNFIQGYPLYYVDGKKLTEEELNTPVPKDSSSNMSILASQDTVDVPAQGSNHQADGKITNAYVQRAMSVIDSFSGSYSIMNPSRESFMIAAGTVGYAAASSCWGTFQDCKSEQSQTCNYVDLI